MPTVHPPKLVRLSDSGLTIVDPEEDVRGRTAYDADGAELGTIDDLYVDETERKVRLLELGTGGVLGLGKQTALVPVDAVARLDENEVYLDTRREKLASTPAFDPALTLENPAIGSVYTHYGYGPYWDDDYRHPGFPYL
jgi:sporulation protein YlmC with PRC-barrel domain